MSVAALLKSIEDQLQDLGWEIRAVAPSIRIERREGESVDDFRRRVSVHESFRNGYFDLLDKDGEPHYLFSSHYSDSWTEEIAAVETKPISRKIEKFVERIREYRLRADSEANYNNHGR